IEPLLAHRLVWIERTRLDVVLLADDVLQIAQRTHGEHSSVRAVLGRVARRWPVFIKVPFYRPRAALQPRSDSQPTTIARMRPATTSHHTCCLVASVDHTISRYQAALSQRDAFGTPRSRNKRSIHSAEKVAAATCSDGQALPAASTPRSTSNVPATASACRGTAVGHR